jgi:hypothetical protein
LTENGLKSVDIHWIRLAASWSDVRFSLAQNSIRGVIEWR